jgi:hypothetical protein
MKLGAVVEVRLTLVLSLSFCVVRVISLLYCVLYKPVQPHFFAIPIYTSIYTSYIYLLAGQSLSDGTLAMQTSKPWTPAEPSLHHLHWRSGCSSANASLHMWNNSRTTTKVIHQNTKGVRSFFLIRHSRWHFHKMSKSVCRRCYWHGLRCNKGNIFFIPFRCSHLPAAPAS